MGDVVEMHDIGLLGFKVVNIDNSSMECLVYLRVWSSNTT